MNFKLVNGRYRMGHGRIFGADPDEGLDSEQNGKDNCKGNAAARQSTALCTVVS